MRAVGGCPTWARHWPLDLVEKGCYGFVDLRYWNEFIGWMLIGGTIGGMLVYIRQLLRE
jgi:hypothetical protein